MDNNRRVFVTGIGTVSPVGLDIASTWEALLQGVSGVDRITSFNAEGFATTFAAEVKGFEPERFMDRKQARRLDRFAQFAVVAAQQALCQAQLKLETVDATRVAAILGSGIGGILTLSEQFGVLGEKGPSRVSPFLIPMMLADMGSGHLSMIFGAKGPNFCPVSSCSSGADAIGLASQMIRRGEVDIALAGGTEAPICPIAVAGFNSCQALSTRNGDPKKASRPFDLDRDGFVMGEGAAVLILESLESLQRRGVPPLAELAGYAASSDAHHVTQPSPGGEGAARAMSLALSRAGLQPHEIDYVNAHGTSTPMNDKYETMSVKSAFGEAAHKLRISSTKSMTGHLLGAAGALEAAVTVMAVAQGAIPPTINLETPDPECDLDYTPTQAYRRPISAAMSNNLGFGGHNASLIFTTPDLKD
ncbi:MAG: beta-ketoacyl-ACP synthase II [Chloroflexi bacterium]|nr:beta-ketoacyl-ACP synthase II [Chloroflexota bacterium]